MPPATPEHPRRDHSTGPTIAGVRLPLRALDMLKNFIAVLLGALTTGMVVAGVQLAGNRLFPAAVARMPDPGDAEAMRLFIASLPVGALAFVVLAWTLGAFVGSLVTLLAARSHQALLAWFIGGLTLALIGATLWRIPHPAWMVATGIVLPLVAVAIAVRLRAPARASPTQQ